MDGRITLVADGGNSEVNKGELLNLFQAREVFHPLNPGRGRWKFWLRPSGPWVIRRDASGTGANMTTKLLTDHVWLDEDGSVWHDGEGRVWHSLE